jgi:hypothetical protein
MIKLGPGGDGLSETWRSTMSHKLLALACALMLSTGVAFAQNNNTGGQGGGNNDNGAANQSGGNSDNGSTNQGSNNLDRNNDGRVSVSDFSDRFGSLNEQEQGLLFSGFDRQQLQGLRDECKNDAAIADKDRDFCDRLNKFNND